MKIVNLTLHEIVIQNNSLRINIPSGGNCRVDVIQSLANKLKLDDEEDDGIPVVFNKYGDIKGLPKPEKDTIYLVSPMVLNALQTKRANYNSFVKEEYRADVYAPDTGSTAIRDEQGKIIAVTQLVKN